MSGGDHAVCRVEQCSDGVLRARVVFSTAGNRQHNSSFIFLPEEL